MMCPAHGDETVVSLFAGPGGSCLGAHAHGLRPLGIEWDDACCETRRAAGLRTLQADVSELDPRDYPAHGLIATPPCQAFSMAGKGAGRDHLPEILECLRDLADGVDSRAEHNATCEDDRAMLVVEPLRWALALRPRWVALEQVPPVLAVWQVVAEHLRDVGYSVWTGVLSSEQYGTVAVCPEHDQRPVPTVPRPLSPTSLATADPAETWWEGWAASAQNAERRSTYSTSLESVLRVAIGDGIGSTRTAALNDAWTVASLGRAALDAAPNATWRGLVRSLLSRALPARQTMRGRVAATWTNAAMSESGWVASTGESIAWLPSRFWAELCYLARSFTTSTGTAGTTPLTTSGCSPTTGTTLTSITPERSRDACSLCDDVAVPQTRRRAVLVASLDGVVQPPIVSHQRFVPGKPAGGTPDSLFGPGLRPWVSMAEALGWGYEARPSNTLVTRESGGGAVGSVLDGGSGSRKTLRDAQASGSWRMRAGHRDNAAVRSVEEPSPTIIGGHDTANRVWTTERPAPTIVGTRRSDAGMLVGLNADDERAGREYDGRAGENAVRVTVQEAAILQGFPPDWPWQGSRTAQFRQVGDAWPPAFAAAVIGAALAPSIGARGEVAA